MASNVPEVLVAELKRVHAWMESRQVRVWVVGGLLRDAWMGRPPRGLNADLAVEKNALRLAKELAAAFKAGFVPLDEEHGSARVVLGSGVELDLNDLRAPTLEDDLRLRDFTINAAAVLLEDWLRRPDNPSPVIDPLGAHAALAQKKLIPCFPGTFKADPVRILRAWRFFAQLQFELDGSADSLMKEALPYLASVPGERVRDELLLIFQTDAAYEALVRMEKHRVLDVLFPELVQGRGVDQGDFHHLDVLGHQLEAVRQADRILADFSEFSGPLRPVLESYCAQELVEKRSRKSLIKLGALLHDIGKPANRQVHADGEIWFIGHEHTGADMAGPIAKRLCLSNQESDMLVRLVRHHLRPGFLSRETELTRRAVYRYYKDLEDHGPACLLMWWCDRLATRGKKSHVDQIDQQRAFLEGMLQAYFFKAEEVVRPPRLLDGNKLMEVLGLKPGPLIGRLLAAIEEAQAEGRIRSAEEALALAKEQAHNQQ